MKIKVQPFNDKKYELKVEDPDFEIGYIDDVNAYCQIKIKGVEQNIGCCSINEMISRIGSIEKELVSYLKKLKKTKEKIKSIKKNTNYKKIKTLNK